MSQADTDRSFVDPMDVSIGHSIFPPNARNNPIK